MSDKEDLVRQTFAEQEQQVTVPIGLAESARGRARKRRVQFATGGTVVALAAAITLGLAVGGDRSVPPATTGPPEDWQWMSSAGAELQIPASWIVDDVACSPARSFFGARRACDATVEGDRPLVEINGGGASTQGGQSITIDGQVAHRATTTLSDGRTQVIIRFDDLPLVVTASLTDTALLDRILDTVTLTAIDHVGCPTGAPPTGRPAASTTATEKSILPGTAAEIVACQYGKSKIRASARLDPNQALRLITALESAPAGSNPDQPGRCTEVPTYPITVIARYPDRNPVTVHIRYWGCTDRGLDNGTQISQVTKEIMSAVLSGLKTSTAYGNDLPTQ